MNKEFKTASMCGGWTFGQCVAVKRDNKAVRVKDTKTGDVLTFSHDEWRAFINGVKNNEFDV